MKKLEEAAILINKIAGSLNSMDHPTAKLLLDEFDRKFNGEPLPIEFIYKKLICSSELALRTGRSNDSVNEIIKQLPLFDNYPDLKFDILLRLGRLEKSRNRMGISPKYFSEALGFAESTGKKDLIARAYSEISAMFGLKYQGLAMYFLRKAEKLFQEINDKHNLSITLLKRAYLCIISYRIKEILKNRDRLQAESIRLIEQIDPSPFNIYEKRQYDYYKAVILEDLDALEELIKKIKNIEALPDKCLYRESYIGLCLEKGEFEKAKLMSAEYFEDSKRLHGDTQDLKQRQECLESIINARTPIIYIPHHIAPNPIDTCTLFDILDHYALQDELWALDNSTMRMLFPFHEQEGDFEPVEMPDGTCRLFPFGLAFNIYYRGQSRHYPESKPTLYRKGMTPAKQFIERIKYIELKDIIEKYPITKMLRNDLSVIAPDGTRIPLPLSIDSLALAQHYGIKTELMDLTTDKFIAAFFATTDCNDDVYTPITDNRKEKGVFYRYSPIPLFDGNDKLRAVGLQPFSRPGEQCGLVYEMGRDDDFNNIVNSSDFFNHDKDVSEFIFNYTNRGEKLFPNSPLELHANAIKESKKVSRQAYNDAKKEFYPDVTDEVLNSYIEEEGFEIVDEIDFNFTQKELDECEKSWNNGDKERMLKKIRPRFMYTNPHEC